jgi:hypothetical protein
MASILVYQLSCFALMVFIFIFFVHDAMACMYLSISSIHLSPLPSILSVILLMVGICLFSTCCLAVLAGLGRLTDLDRLADLDRLTDLARLA